MHLENGLTDQEASRNFSTYGPNELPDTQPKRFSAMVLEVVSDPMVAMLLAGAGVYVLLGEPKDAALLTLSVVVITVIALFQERRSTRALEALRELASPVARVIREGRERQIRSREVVPGDIMLVREGDKLPADGCVLSSHDLRCDESLLTGESESVLKTSGGLLYRSTLATSGAGLARVTATGLQTEVGKIGSSIRELSEEQTKLQKECVRIVRSFGLLGFGASAAIVLLYGFTRGDWPHAFLAGIAAAMSLLPEEFPVILHIFLALGAWRLAKTQVLVRRIASTENLGSITVLCVDKTGTLTMNQMAVSEVRTPTEDHILGLESPSTEVRSVIEGAVLASRDETFDPMENALRRALGTAPDSSLTLEREYPVSARLFAMTRVWRADAPERMVWAKGAPEAILDMCHSTSAEREPVMKQVREMSGRGQRLLAVARASATDGELPETQFGFSFRYLGVIGIADPVRPGVTEAIDECARAGIRVIMMTGDFPGTAAHVANEIGLRPSEVLTGPELERMDEATLASRLPTVNVFARVVPAQKLKIVRALQARGEVVAMTGDGVNDAPSLKAADVGIAMGGKGTDVAREASDIVLLDDHFASIVAGIRVGRSIYENIKRAITYVMSIHVPIAGLAIAPLFLGLPLVLFPSHIVFIELIIDPACTLVFEARPAGASLMSRPPRRPNQTPFSSQDILASLSDGAILFVVLLGLFVGSLAGGWSTEQARALTFVAFVFGNLGSIAADLSFENSRRLWTLAVIAVLALAGVLGFESLRDVFGFEELGFFGLALALLTALGATVLKIVLSCARHDPCFAGWHGDRETTRIDESRLGDRSNRARARGR